MQIDLELYRSEVLVSDRPRVRLSAIDRKGLLPSDRNRDSLLLP